MTISPPERGKTAKDMVDRNPVPATFELFEKPGHFDRSLAKGPKTTTWLAFLAWAPCPGLGTCCMSRCPQRS